MTSPLYLLAVVRMCTATAAVSGSHMCDTVNKSPDQYCQDYCTGKCSFYNISAGDSGSPLNQTLYRLTPQNVRGIANHNTGDVAGDVGFILANRRKALECLNNQTSRGCFLDNSSANIYGAFDVEIDGQFGPYLQCNPEFQNASKPFECWQKCDTPPNCTNTSGYNSWVNGTSGWAGPACFCPSCAHCSKAVGRAPNPYTWHGHVPKGWPKQCYSFDEVKGDKCFSGDLWKTFSSQSLASVLELVCDACDYRSPCVAFSVRYSQNKYVAKVFSKVQHNSSAGNSCISGTWGDHWGGSVGVAIGGIWYSTPTAGMCPPGGNLGVNGCTWRYTGPERYYDNDCVDDRVDIVVEKHGKLCFDTCVEPKNKSSLCYLTCYQATLEGDPLHNITAMKPEAITEPWRRAFLPMKDGGCPKL